MGEKKKTLADIYNAKVEYREVKLPSGERSMKIRYPTMTEVKRGAKLSRSLGESEQDQVMIWFLNTLCVELNGVDVVKFKEGDWTSFYESFMKPADTMYLQVVLLEMQGISKEIREEVQGFRPPPQR